MAHWVHGWGREGPTHAVRHGIETPMVRVLMIDDEQSICRAVQRALRSRGMVVDAYQEVGVFLEAARVEEHQVLLIDWNLRTCQGTDLTAQLRRDGETRGIAILSGKLEVSHARDLVERSGGDTFVPKPIAMKELAQKVSELARLPPRTRRSSGPYHLDPDTNEAASLELLSDGSVVLHEHRIRLGATEHRLFIYLVEHLGRDVTNEELTEHAFGLPPAKHPDVKRRHDHLVHVNVNRLRKRLGGAVQITTIAGGYRIHGDSAPRRKL